MGLTPDPYTLPSLAHVFKEGTFVDDRIFSVWEAPISSLTALVESLPFSPFLVCALSQYFRVLDPQRTQNSATQPIQHIEIYLAKVMGRVLASQRSLVPFALALYNTLAMHTNVTEMG